MILHREPGGSGTPYILESVPGPADAGRCSDNPRLLVRLALVVGAWLAGSRANSVASRTTESRRFGPDVLAPALATAFGAIKHRCPQPVRGALDIEGAPLQHEGCGRGCCSDALRGPSKRCRNGSPRIAEARGGSICGDGERFGDSSVVRVHRVGDWRADVGHVPPHVLDGFDRAAVGGGDGIDEVGDDLSDELAGAVV